MSEEIDEQEVDLEEESTDTEDSSKTTSDEEDIDWKARALKAEQTAENYKKEIEVKGLRKKPRKVEASSVEGSEDVVKTDYLSKRQDVIDDYKEELDKLEDSEWSKIEGLLEPALSKVYDSASKDNRFVAKGELERTVKNLITFALGDKAKTEEIEQARLQGAFERDKIDSGQIKSRIRKPESSSEEVRRLVEEKGWTPEQAKEVVEKRNQRDSEYSVRKII